MEKCIFHRIKKARCGGVVTDKAFYFRAVREGQFNAVVRLGAYLIHGLPVRFHNFP